MSCAACRSVPAGDVVRMVGGALAEVGFPLAKVSTYEEDTEHYAIEVEVCDECPCDDPPPEVAGKALSLLDHLTCPIHPGNNGRGSDHG